mmetsp:Transcript_22394/g.53263  ORF Transcript_22394/g.53263 Transcript_22394/m.53263 type:complete len:163 (+) Transcript_22394:112-600(+)|eukprot:CAMPEP_0197183004 /NCGR_PEP_ID=MMETSP1423-20130617/7236_1 /TAXON_ID=476441 /ORGANISM="Pseudo-nitzschia heimii, Strain UNC1101" /LENGTH=162 /DNA_ID=CAMNT_0042633525 /DNA_START=87 /DNA_END=575 /DNA_ORIENTATION=-
MDPVKPSAEIASGEANYVSHDQEPKRGHVFCGVCCDVRTACIVVNIISLAFAGLGLIGLAPQMDRVGFERFGIVIAIFVLGVISSAFGLFGALKFKKVFTLVATVWFGIEALLALIIFRDYFACMTSIFFFYPHIMFYKEMSDGIMSRDTFPREKNCCGSCC